MTLADWAAIAEIVSAIAVVVTLVYLAVQIRHSKESLDANTKAIRGQAISEITRNVHDQMHMFIQGQDSIGAFQKFVSDEKLGARDAFVIDSILSAVFVARQNEFLQWRQGLLDDDVFESLHHVIHTCLGHPNGQHWWNNEGRRMFAPSFVKFVDELSEAGASESLEAWKRAVRLDEKQGQ